MVTRALSRRWVALLGTLVSISLGATGCAKVDSAAKAEQWFLENQPVLEEIVRDVSVHRAIKRAEPGIREERVVRYADFDGDSLKALRKLRALCDEWGIQDIVVERDPSTAEGEIVVVDFVLYSTGILGDGMLLRVLYLPADRLRQSIRERSKTFKELDSVGWFLVEA